MKRLSIVVLCLLLVLCSVSCSDRKAQPKQGEQEKSQEKEKKENKPDKKQGQELVDGYIKALILRDQNTEAYYSEKMSQGSQKLTPLANPHPNGYKIDSFEEKEGKLEGTVKIFSVYTGEPYFSSDESRITVTKEKGSYAIDKIEKSKTTEVSEKDKTLFMREDGDVEGKEVIKIDELPRFATPQGATLDQKFNVGREKFGPLALDPEGKKLALSTVGENPAVMVLDIEKKQAKPLDIYFGESVQSIAWSQDGKYIAVEMSNREGSRFLYVYEAEKGEKVDDPMKDALKPGKFTVNIPYWISESELVFNVAGVSSLAPEDEKKVGSYKFDVKNVTLTKF